MESDTHQVFGAVRMNDLATLAIRTSKNPTFPVGATIVREKLLSERQLTPEVLAVMIKREKGFNPEAGDWEFLVVNGHANRLEKRQKQGECLACHSAAYNTDFVFIRFP